MQPKRVSNKKKQAAKKGSKHEKRGKIRENERKPVGKPVGKPIGKPIGKPNEKPSKKPGVKPVQEAHRKPGSSRNFDRDQIIAVGHIFLYFFAMKALIPVSMKELGGTLSNYTYMSKSNTMSIFWASDTSSTRKGFRAVYNIIEG